MPRAVSTHRTVCPTEYRQIDTPEWTRGEQENMWTLTISDLEEIEENQTYRIFYNNRAKFWDVVCEGRNTFRVRTHTPPEGPIFLYGKFVDDLLHIDRDDIFSVLYAATQEIDRLVVENSTKLASLEARIAALEGSR